jgi:membrane protein insertase Oxa1/YidC/SpoIIIJ
MTNKTIQILSEYCEYCSFQFFLQYLRLMQRLPKSIMGSKMLLLISIILLIFMVLLVIYAQLASKVAAKIRDIGRKLHSIELDCGFDTRLMATVSQLAQLYKSF